MENEPITKEMWEKACNLGSCDFGAESGEEFLQEIRDATDPLRVSSELSPDDYAVESADTTVQP